MTPERQHFNEVVLPRFIKEYVHKNIVLDVGKPNDGWNYRQMFEGMNYKTLDRRKDLKPDIVDDMEDTKLAEEYTDIVICNGVFEQCCNPFKLVEGLWKVLRRDGYGLLGIMSVGFPMIQDLDLCRFTPQGVDRLLRAFKIINMDIRERDKMPSYIFVTVQK